MANREDLNRQPGSAAANLTAVVESAKDAAANIAQSAIGAASSEMESAKQSVAQGVRRAADALQGTARDLRSGPTAPAAQLLDGAGTKLEAGSDYLVRSSVSDLLFDLGDFVRARPTLVLGTGFLLGLLAGRFFKSSQPRTSAEQLAR